MTDLKPCPDCPTYAVCEHCGASHDTRPAPELPEGYREDEEGNLYFGTVCLAVVDNCGRLMTSVLEHEFPVLAIWLQRRSLER